MKTLTIIMLLTLSSNLLAKELNFESSTYKNEDDSIGAYKCDGLAQKALADIEKQKQNAHIVICYTAEYEKLQRYFHQDKLTFCQVSVKQTCFDALPEEMSFSAKGNGWQTGGLFRKRTPLENAIADGTQKALEVCHNAGYKNCKVLGHDSEQEAVYEREAPMSVIVHVQGTL